MPENKFDDLRVFDSLPVTFWMSHGKSGHYRIAAWNKGATKIYGWTAAEAIGRSYLDLFVDPEPKVRQQSMIDADAVIDDPKYQHPINCLAIDRNRNKQEVILLTNVFRYEHAGIGYQAEIGVDLTPSGFLNFIDEEFKNKRTGPDHKTERTLEALLNHAQTLYRKQVGLWIRTYTHETRSHLAVINNALAELSEETPGLLSEPLYGDIAHAARQLQLQSDNFLSSEMAGFSGYVRRDDTVPSSVGEAILAVVDEYLYTASTLGIAMDIRPMSSGLSSRAKHTPAIAEFEFTIDDTTLGLLADLVVTLA